VDDFRTSSARRDPRQSQLAEKHTRYGSNGIFHVTSKVRVSSRRAVWIFSRLVRFRLVWKTSAADPHSWFSMGNSERSLTRKRFPKLVPGSRV
jgi:hypothetical protein